MSDELNVETVAEIVQSIFSTMMDLPVSVISSPRVPSSDKLTSSVYLEGTWNGAVTVECTRKQACQFAGKILAIDPPDEVDNDVRDVIGELANMIGGNMKSAMGTDVRLSLPSVIDGSDYEVRVCGSQVREDIAFRYDGGDFWVSVLAKTALAKA